MKHHCPMCGEQSVPAGGGASGPTFDRNSQLGLLTEARAAETMLSQLLAALNKATELGATRVDVGDLRVAVEHRLKPLRAAIAKAEQSEAEGGAR
jgi:hypothetical protein